MKKKIISVIGVILVIITVVLSVVYLRGGSGGGMSKEDMEKDQMLREELQETANTLGSSGEADEAAKAFAATLKEKRGIDVDARNIVSTGKPLVSGQFTFTVNSWNISKEYPGYEPPEGVDLAEWPGAEVDGNGNIINDFTYVTVDISAENMKAEEVTQLIWGMIRLRIFDSGDYTGEAIYYGRDIEREYGHYYGQETFQANETKSVVLIFVVKDELLQNQEMYLEINPSGAQTVNPDYDVRRFIILN